MVHALAGAGAAVDDDAEVAMTLGDGDLLCHPMEVAEEGVVRGGEIVQGRDVLARQDEQMERRAGIDVADHDRVLVLVHARRPCLAATDSAEEAVGHAFRLTVFGRHPQEYPEYSMDFGFTPEQELLRRTARDLLTDRAPMARVRQMIADDSGLDDADWRRMAALGWQGLVVPEQYGGAGLGLLELAIVLEEMGRALLPGPFLATTLAALALVAGGSDAQRARWLPRIGDGSTRATFALVEESGRWDPAAVAARAQSGGEALVLSGTKRFVPEAAGADIIVCAVRRDDGALALVLVEAGARGVTIAPLATMDRTRRVDDVVLDGVRVDAEQVLPCDAATVAARLLDRGRVMLAADMAGGAERVLEMTVEYAKVRRQFGHAIGSFQAIQHQCADMSVEVEKAKAATYYAACADAEAAADAALAAAQAKAIAGDAYRFVTARAIQIHGGIGFTWEHDVHLYFKRAQSGEMTFGDATSCRELAAQRLGL